MTRKDFQLIAEVVASIEDMNARNYTGVQFAWRLSKTNSRFNAQKFLEACGCESR